jgi:RND family efflux transporter MFP subunit
MKRIRIIGIASAIFLASCAGKSTDKRAELDKLKKERQDLNNKISALEMELGDKNAEVNAKNVNVYNVAESVFMSYIEVQGRVDAEENVQVNPETGGMITAISVHAGQNVTKGQVLAQIDDQVLRQSIAELQNQLDLANTLFQRQKNLWDQKIGTEVQYLNAKTQKEGIERRIATLNSQLAMYKIKSPISGTVDAMDLRVGQSVAPGMMSAIRVVNASKLKAKALVAESYSGRINQGDKVIIILPDVPDTIETNLSFASKTIDPLSRSFSIEAQLPSNHKYHPNMLTILKVLDYKNPKALTIPINAIQKAENTDYVFVVVSGKAKRVDIKTGKAFNSSVEVLSGLKVGDQVITAGMQNLNDGDAVSFK